tara:strand:+ start:399 stop:650 length:252 start_codon:yes stop_codon:yes gene_type:complete
MKNKITELLNKNVIQDEYGNYILDAYPSDIENLVNELLEAINYTHSCESDSEQLVCDDNELDCSFDFTSRCTMGRCNCKPKAS